MTESNAITFTEDYLSAIVSARYTDSIGLFGTTLCERALESVTANNYQKAYVFLDNDNVAVRADERALKRMLELFIPEVEWVQLTDPKKCSKEVLDGIYK